MLSYNPAHILIRFDNGKISKIEKGRVNITFNTIVQFAEALKVKVSELMDID